MREPLRDTGCWHAATETRRQTHAQLACLVLAIHSQTHHLRPISAATRASPKLNCRGNGGKKKDALRGGSRLDGSTRVRLSLRSTTSVEKRVTSLCYPTMTWPAALSARI